MNPVLQAIHEYYRIFSTLDLDAIADCFTEPCMSMSPAGVFGSGTRSELSAALLPMIESLRAKKYGYSEFQPATLTELTDSVAVVKGTAVRFFASGEEMERVALSYVLHKDDAADWKIAVLVLPA